MNAQQAIAGGAFAPLVDNGTAAAPIQLPFELIGSDDPAGVSPACCVDFNGDTEVDFSDVEQFLVALAGMVAGNCAPGADFNGDTEFDFSDIEVFIGVFNSAVGTTCTP